MPLLAHTPSVAHLVVRVIPHLGCDNLTYSSSSNRPPVRQQYDFAESVGAIMAEGEKKEEAVRELRFTLADCACAAESTFSVRWTDCDGF